MPSANKVGDVRYIVAINKHNLQHKSSNKIKTSKYEWWNFVFLNLYEQFRRFANLYFLLIVVLQIIPGVSPFPIITSVAPVLFILGVSAIKEAFEDTGRHKADNRVNSAPHATLPRDAQGQLRTVKSRDIKVGDVLHIKKGEEFPADLMLLRSAKEDGTCSITTGSLDGEAAPKFREAPMPTRKLSNEALAKLEGAVYCPQPSAKLYGFEGLLSMETKENAADSSEWAFDDKSVLLRSAKLADPEWIKGVVMYIGPQTKMMMNRNPTKFKFSNFEYQLNQQVKILFMLMLFLCLSQTLWFAFSTSSMAFLAYVGLSHSSFQIGLNFITQFILYSFMIPMPLYVTIEIVLLGQAFFIKWDTELLGRPPLAPIEEPMVGCQVKNASLNPDLGRVEYVFSDKTGTLTENDMTLVRCYTGGNFYSMIKSEPESRSEKVAAPPEVRSLPDFVAKLISSPVDADALLSTPKGENSSVSQTDTLGMEFVLGLALCNSASVMDRKFLTDSPDEMAFLLSMQALGVELTKRAGANTLVTLKPKGMEPQELRFMTQAMLPFESAFRRMSVVVRWPTGHLFIYSKGADSAIMPHVRVHTENERAKLSAAEAATLSMAQQGSRTLALSGRRLTEEEFVDWLPRYVDANTVTKDRNIQIEKVFQELEMDMHLLGVTAVNDRMQDGVPSTVHRMHQANMRVIILTGDMKETAVHIGRETGLVTDGMRLLFLEGLDVASARASLVSASKVPGAKDIIGLPYPASLDAEACGPLVDGNTSNKTIALCCSGDVLEMLLNQDEKGFVQQLQRSETLVVYRCSPAQKRMAVVSTKRVTGATCLAVGDGANDVSMLLVSDIGVGIQGKEGSHAAMAGDYSLIRFRHLQRLLFVHGRWSIKRTSLMSLIMFYKSFCFIMPIWWHGFFSGGDATVIWDPMLLSGFSPVIAALPPFVLGMLEQDLSQRECMKFPQAYAQVVQHHPLGMRRFCYYMLLGAWQSVIIYIFVLHTWDEQVIIGGHFQSGGLWVSGNAICVVASVVINIQMVVASEFITIWLIIAVVLGLAAMFLAVLLFSSFASWDSDLLGVVPAIAGTPNVMLSLIFSGVVCYLPSLLMNATLNTLRPAYLYEAKMWLRKHPQAALEMTQLDI